MSNSLAIANVTATLSAILDHALNANPLDDPASDPGLAGTGVTTKSLDKARTGTGNQVNLFLYQTTHNASWRNRDMPRQSKPGEVAFPPLALDLHYLITAYGQSDDDLLAQRILGRALSVLHDHPVLSRQELKAALPGADLGDQIERIRLLPHNLTVEELSKLWTTFQAPYRLSAVLQVSVVLIESNRAVQANPPVLRRGEDNQGIHSQPDLASPFPTLDSLVLPKRQPSLKPGDALNLLGINLSGTAPAVLFKHQRWDEPQSVAAEAGSTDANVKVLFPDQPALWPAGFYTAMVEVQRDGDSYRRVTNALPFSVAPRIASPLPLAAAAGSMLTLDVSPHVLETQRVSLFLGGLEVPARPHPGVSASLDFQLPADLTGEFLVRLRVDGVDSLVVQDYAASLPSFDPLQKVTLA